MDTQTREEVRQGFADGTYHNPGYSLPCSNCGKSTTIYEENGQWFCWTCGLSFPRPIIHQPVIYLDAELEEWELLERMIKFLEEG